MLSQPAFLPTLAKTLVQMKVEDNLKEYGEGERRCICFDLGI